METTKELEVFLENKPGRLANVCLALAKEKVNIMALTVTDSRDRSVLRVVTDNLPQTRKVLQALNTPFAETEVVYVELRNHPGALAQVCEQLGEEHINIDHAYCSAGTKNGKTVGIFKVNNPGKALKVLSESPGTRARRLTGRRPMHAIGARRRGGRM